MLSRLPSVTEKIKGKTEEQLITYILMADCFEQHQGSNLNATTKIQAIIFTLLTDGRLFRLVGTMAAGSNLNVTTNQKCQVYNYPTDA